jgi:hypothetical protein
MTPADPTAHTSELEDPQTLVNGKVVPLVSDDQVEPFQWRITPL